MTLEPAADVTTLMHELVAKVPFAYVDPTRVVCMRSFGATSRAYARIWSFPKIWQLALDKDPHYVIEVLSHHYDRLSPDEKTRTIIHELMHIPKNFSGALVPHRGIHKRIDRRTVEKLFEAYRNNL